MAQTTINNGDSGAAVRGALNTMFGELYASGYYIEVANYSTLVATYPAASHTGEIYVCLADEGTWILGTKKAAGLWTSNGTAWSRLGPALNAAAIYFSAAGGVAGTDVQAAIEELDTEKTPKQSGTILGQRDYGPVTTCADAIQDVTFDFAAGNSRYIDASAVTGGKAVALLASNFPSGANDQVVYTIYLKIGAARPSFSAPAGWAVGTLLSAITLSKTSVFTLDYFASGAPTITLLREY